MGVGGAEVDGRVKRIPVLLRWEERDGFDLDLEVLCCLSPHPAPVRLIWEDFLGKDAPPDWHADARNPGRSWVRCRLRSLVARGYPVWTGTKDQKFARGGRASGYSRPLQAGYVMGEYAWVTKGGKPREDPQDAAEWAWVQRECEDYWNRVYPRPEGA